MHLRKYTEYLGKFIIAASLVFSMGVQAEAYKAPRGPDGKHVPFGQYGTHIWKKYPGLGWRIVHEHLTAYDVAKDQQK